MTRVQVECLVCRGFRVHLVLREYVANYTEELEDGSRGWWDENRFQICKCQACETIRFRHSYHDVAMQQSQESERVELYPKAVRHVADTVLVVLPIVGLIYSETVSAFNSDLLVLAGGGLRATVEAICNEKQISGKRLADRIDSLVSQGLLAKQQADLLHEARFIGNAALHEVERPPESEIAIGIEIVEVLLKTVYVLPVKAAELRRLRSVRGTLTDSDKQEPALDDL